ncbi:hypothetical protein SDC9_100095 [bioreactor metagenome]|uniref:Uncharacterized protein n=1 Tax=bioreactor metagenome TaxID=1076179 RepID=A0A645AKR8_9ZZZZ
MSYIQNGFGLKVVGAQQTATAVVSVDSLKQVPEVMAGRALPQDHIHPPGQPLPHLRHRGAFVVGADTGGGIGVQGFPLHGRAVSVYEPVVSLGGDNLVQIGVRPGNHAGEIHKFPHPVELSACQRLLHGRRVDHRAGMLERGGGHAGGQHPLDIKGGGLARVDHVPQPGKPTDIRHFVGVGYHRGGTQRHDQPPQLLGRHAGGFNMDVTVYEAGRGVGPACVHLPQALVPAEARDQLLAYGNVAVDDAAVVHVDDAAVFNHQVRGNATSRHVKELFQL